MPHHPQLSKCLCDVTYSRQLSFKPPTTKGNLALSQLLPCTSQSVLSTFSINPDNLASLRRQKLDYRPDWSLGNEWPDSICVFFFRFLEHTRWLQEDLYVSTPFWSRLSPVTKFATIDENENTSAHVACKRIRRVSATLILPYTCSPTGCRRDPRLRTVSESRLTS